eukprot:357204-Chlamydomonas_euryale.AAC.8
MSVSPSRAPRHAAPRPSLGAFPKMEGVDLKLRGALPVSGKEDVQHARHQASDANVLAAHAAAHTHFPTPPPCASARDAAMFGSAQGSSGNQVHAARDVGGRGLLSAAGAAGACKGLLAFGPGS